LCSLIIYRPKWRPPSLNSSVCAVYNNNISPYHLRSLPYHLSPGGAAPLVKQRPTGVLTAVLPPACRRRRHRRRSEADFAKSTKNGVFTMDDLYRRPPLGLLNAPVDARVLRRQRVSNVKGAQGGGRAQCRARRWAAWTSERSLRSLWYRSRPRRTRRLCSGVNSAAVRRPSAARPMDWLGCLANGLVLCRLALSDSRAAPARASLLCHARLARVTSGSRVVWLSGWPWPVSRCRSS
jgi:hypothetical protein